jgi:glutamine synthetase
VKHGVGTLALMDKQTEFVLRTLEERDIRFVRLWFTDVLGFLKSVAVAPAELEAAFSEGSRFFPGGASPTVWPACSATS